MSNSPVYSGPSNFFPSLDSLAGGATFPNTRCLYVSVFDHGLTEDEADKSVILTYTIATDGGALEKYLADARTGGQWWRYLPRARKKRTPRRAKAGQCGGIRNRVSIAERPDVVATRCRLGDWEIDTVVSAGKKTAVLTAVERKSRLYLARHVPSRSADAVSKALIQLLKPYAAQGQVHTITSDNGREFAGHEKIASALKNELVHHHRYATRSEAEASIREYIEIFYNRQRRHSRLGNVSPAVFAQKFSKQVVGI